MTDKIEFMDLLLKMYKDKAKESESKSFQEFYDKHKEIMELRENEFKKLEVKPEPPRLTEINREPITDLNLEQIKEV